MINKIIKFLKRKQIKEGGYIVTRRPDLRGYLITGKEKVFISDSLLMSGIVTVQT